MHELHYVGPARRHRVNKGPAGAAALRVASGCHCGCDRVRRKALRDAQGWVARELLTLRAARLQELAAEVMREMPKLFHAMIALMQAVDRRGGRHIPPPAACLAAPCPLGRNHREGKVFKGSRRKNEMLHSLRSTLQLVMRKLPPLPLGVCAKQRLELLPLLVGDALGEGDAVGDPQVAAARLQGRKAGQRQVGEHGKYQRVGWWRCRRHDGAGM